MVKRKDSPDDNKEKYDVPIDSEEAKENARRIEAYRRGVIEERWLVTHILTNHLEIESVMNELLRKKLPKPEKLLDRNGQKPTFAQKLTLCESLDIISDDLAVAIRALNKLRNESAHNLGYIPTSDDLSRFIASMSKIHPLDVIPAPGEPAKELRTVQQIREHFDQTDRDEVEHFVFFSILLLKAGVSVLLNKKSTKKT